MRDQVIGKCSICGGRVMQYLSLGLAGPWPPAVCADCGAVEDRPGPVIPMKPRGQDKPPSLRDRVNGAHCE